jgi:eukaryotic-like serine/threonine-protein kinase
MPSERIQRQIDRLLDEAERGVVDGDWNLVRTRAEQALRLDPRNADATTYLEAANREPIVGRMPPPPTAPAVGEDALPSTVPAPLPSRTMPTSFASGRYLVKRFLGEGGKKRVYLAHDTLLDRDVAFALIKTEGLDQAGRDRITREAQAMGRLGTHPHIVSVFDLGEEPPRLPGEQDSVAGPREYELLRQPFIVTELMGGGDVEGLIEKAPEHRPPLERTLEIGIEVCQGLEFAHRHGIVHRDLKPGNVWLTTDSIAKLGDFGLAVAIDKTRLTQAGMMVGTVSYMPPEQATGGAVTPRSDLYSFGAMLYELVTGRPPFVGDEAVAIIGQHLNTAPVAPSWHNAEVPPGLETMVLRLLEKDPAKRPQSAAEVREALEHVRRQTVELEARQAGSTNGATDVITATSDNPLYRRVFVGREQELKQLQAAVDGALSGRGALAMVVGEPGIGKTAVCEQLATYVTLRGGLTLTGHCYEEGSLSLPYLAFVEALRSYASSRPPEELRSQLGTAASDLARIVSEVRERLAVDPRPPGDPEEDRWRLLQAVSGFLRNAATVQPLLLVLEDLHWADQGTLDLLVHLSRNLQGARLLVIGTYRDVEVDRSHPLSAALAELRRGSEFGRVLLRGLGTPEVQRMLEAITGETVPGSLAESIHRQTEGNPLFVQEVVRYLVEEGHLGHGQGAAALSSIAIPEGLRDVIGRRLSRLSPECNRVLAVAGVIGREFGLETLHAVVELDEEQVVSSLEEALHIGVLEEQSRPGSIRYRFAHAFFRQTLYEELIAPRRLRLHQQVAAALERQYAGRLEEHAAELAEHFAQSTDRDDLAKAVQYGELAAERAMSVYAYGEAVRHLEQALAVQDVLDPDDKLKRCDLLLALGEALLPSEEPERVIELAAEEAFALGDALDDHDRAARAAIMALEALFRSSSSALQTLTPASRVWCERADRSAQPGTVLRVYAGAYVGINSVQAVSRERGHEYLRRAAALGRQLDDNNAFYTSAGLAMMRLLAQRDHSTRYVLAKEALQRDRRGVRSADLALCLRSAAEVLLEHGDRAAAAGAWADLRELAARSRDLTLKAWADETRQREAFVDGRLEEVVELASAMREESQAAGIQATGDWVSARATLYLGGPFDRFLEQGEPLARPQLAARARILAHLGRREEALTIGAGFIGIERDEDESGMTILMSLFEAALLAGDAKTAEALSRRLAPFAAAPWCPTACTSYGRLLGGAAKLAGHPERAPGYYEQALEACEKIRFRPEIALINLELAELFLDDAHEANLPEALHHLDFAIGEFRDMKMQPSLERALRHKDVLKA